ncbi:hypothetical protein [Aurantimonas coralicida]|uniref:hypothetical protein n=1 Tax=Aurantimonas coralicida TaxID=182270 RepID=UPI001E440122|nr:hypothetical protein [Aurantimonas coralicida]MCD1644166.1 hypothetical protein [Aurantimonas coralicida]
MDDLFGGGSKTQQTQTSSATQYPAWTQNANQATTTAGMTMGSPFLQVPKNAVAGLNNDQMKAFDLARQSAQSAYQPGPTATPTGSYQAANVGPANMATAQTMNAGDIGAYMNPYMEGVIDPAVQMARRQANATQSDIGSRAASAQAMGGSQEAMERALARRSANENMVGTVANMMSSGYDRAQGYAQNQANTRQQTELANVGDRNQFALQQANYEQQANMGNPGLALDQARLQDSMRTSDLSRQMNALQQLLGAGNQQQLFAQKAMDVPKDTLSWMAGFVPNVYNTNTSGTQTSPDNSPGFLQQLLGVGATLGGKALGL